MDSFILNSKGTCECPGPFYLSNGLCNPCPSTCEKCNEDICTLCFDGHILYNGSCYRCEEFLGFGGSLDAVDDYEAINSLVD